ncbi:MAG TPA: gamma-glutamyl-gamma-aminobutyrate hydrolase family protein, partial [Gemmataceae bacterium]|nr:gamma-glutamyl-gamma-aminobutyrate hydrolase family protein [Gemmataceae bacterium]
EFSRNVLGLAEANSTEMDAGTPHPVVCLLDDQFHITDKGGTMRLGSYACSLKEGSRAHEAYASSVIHERHRHRYELNNRYRKQLEDSGFLVTGTSPDGNLVEVIELRNHPWFLAVQCHPEFKSKPIKAHPLFREFVRASLEQRGRRKSGGIFRSRPQVTSLSGS